jgi:hypothetical protein
MTQRSYHVTASLLYAIQSEGCIAYQKLGAEPPTGALGTKAQRINMPRYTEAEIEEITLAFCHVLSIAEHDKSLNPIIIEAIKRAEQSPSDCVSIVALKLFLQTQID